MPSKPYWDDRREKFAQALAGDMSTVAAGKLVGYSAANARRNANRKDVKARVAQLRAPSLAKVQAQIDINVEWATKKLAAMAGHDIGPAAKKDSDKIAALNLLAKIGGWLAAEKHDVTVTDLAERLDRARARLGTK